MAIARVGGPLWLSLICTAWGIVAGCFAAINSRGAFLALRCLLGVAEAGALPGARRAGAVVAVGNAAVGLESKRRGASREQASTPCSQLSMPPPAAGTTLRCSPLATSKIHPLTAGMWFYVAQFYPPPRLTVPMTLVMAGAAPRGSRAGHLTCKRSRRHRRHRCCAACPARRHHSGAGHWRATGGGLPGDACECYSAPSWCNGGPGLGWRWWRRLHAQLAAHRLLPPGLDTLLAARAVQGAGGLAGWRWLFLLEAIPAVLLGLSLW